MSRPSSLFPFFTALVLLVVAGASAEAKSTTSTTLQATSPCVAEGCVTTLTATVVSGSTPIHPGLVYFCDGAIANCANGIPIGQGQLLANGMATIKRTLSPGVHHLHARFVGTATYAASSSASQDLTIAADSNPVTTTSITANGSTFAESLQANVVGLNAAAPTGTVSFLDTSNSNASVGSAVLSASSNQFKYLSGGLDVSQISSGLLTSVTAAIAGDFNGDGLSDILVLTPSGVRVLLGDGHGKLTEGPSTSNVVGTQSAQIVVGDFNSDGKLDFVVPDSSTKKIYVCLGNGDGTFHDAATVTLSSPPQKIVIGDVNNDGSADLVVTTQTITNNTATYTVKPLLGVGDGSFSTTASAITGYAVGALADFDSDGTLDIAAVTETGVNQANLIILHGNGDATFTPLPHPSPVNDGGALLAGDFNGDGIPDIVVYDGAVIVYMQGKGDGTFPAGTVQASFGSSFTTLLAGDFNGDGTLDLGIVGQPDFNPGSDFLTLFLGDNSASDFNFNGGPEASVSGSINVVADFTSDGLLDLLAFGATPPSSYVGGYKSVSVASTAPISIAGAGIHKIVASYPGDGLYAASTSAPVPIQGVQGPDFSQGFTSSSGIALNGGATIQGGVLHLTDGNSFESRSAFYPTRVPTYNFNTAFDFQITGGGGDGLAFVLQANGANAIGSPGGGIGYGQSPGATSGASITHSLAFVLDLHGNQGEGSNSMRIETGGITAVTPSLSQNLNGSGIDLHSGHHFRAMLSGTSTNLLVTLTDLDTQKVYSRPLTVDLFKALGDTVGYVGFTSSTGAQTSNVLISNWKYAGEACCSTTSPTSAVPSFYSDFTQGATQIHLNNGAAITAGALQLTNSSTFQANSAYFIPKIAPSYWTTDFDFVISGSGGDGFTFVLQNQGIAAVGTSGGGLGYGPAYPGAASANIPNSIAVKFDLHNNAGEGSDSTGIYVNGASPTTPSVDLSGSPIHLHSGHIFHARMYYDPAGLTHLSITDLTRYAVFDTVLPHAVLNQYAFIGFTAGTGASTNVVKILNWTWNYYDTDLTP